jgi:hypothetical protein
MVVLAFPGLFTGFCGDSSTAGGGHAQRLHSLGYNHWVTNVAVIY